MKSYTDLEQSKMLAEFLPLESADMSFVKKGNEKFTWYDAENRRITTAYEEKYYVPCWSLAALLDALPNNKHITTIVSRGGWQIEPINYLPNTWWCEYEDSDNLTEFNTSADNPIDACYEMILKLNELNLL